jgi:hypothetical protein
MSAPRFPVLCYTPGCGRPADFKVAARWSDGATEELKTYGLCCREHLPGWFRRARQRQAACGLAPGETLDPPGIFRRKEGQRDAELQRDVALERELGR